MPTFRSPVSNFTFETLIAFVGALLVLPLLFKLFFSVIRGLFKLTIFRKLLFDSVIVGATALLTREEVLDKVFGPRNGQSATRERTRVQP